MDGDHVGILGDFFKAIPNKSPIPGRPSPGENHFRPRKTPLMLAQILGAQHHDDSFKLGQIEEN